MEVYYFTQTTEEAQRLVAAGAHIWETWDAGPERFKENAARFVTDMHDKAEAVFVVNPYADDADEITSLVLSIFPDEKPAYFWDSTTLFEDPACTRTYTEMIKAADPDKGKGYLEDNKQEFFDIKTHQAALRAGLGPVQEYKDLFIKNRSEVSAGIRSGFRSIDIMLNGGFRNELYVLTSGTGTGKSALAAVIAQNIAQQKIDVLYYCLEMGRDEFIARGVSMISKEKELAGGRAAIPFSAILGEDYNERTQTFERVPEAQYEEYLAEYMTRYGQHLYFRQGGIEGTYARKIAEEVKEFKRKNKAQRVVCILDYLQLLDADPKDKTQRDKTSIMSAAIRSLKALASQDGCTVIVLSSKSNAQKNQESDEYSTKYSGDIGYTAGVSIGWEWDGMTNTDSDDTRKKTAKTADNRGFRSMIFRLNKNRNGKRGADQHINYYPAYNYLEEAKGGDKDGDGGNWQPLKGDDEEELEKRFRKH